MYIIFNFVKFNTRNKVRFHKTMRIFFICIYIHFNFDILHLLSINLFIISIPPPLISILNIIKL